MAKYKNIAETVLTFSTYDQQALYAYRVAEWKDEDHICDSFTIYFTDHSSVIDYYKEERMELGNLGYTKIIGGRRVNA